MSAIPDKYCYIYNIQVSKARILYFIVWWNAYRSSRLSRLFYTCVELWNTSLYISESNISTCKDLLIVIFDKENRIFIIIALHLH